MSVSILLATYNNEAYIAPLLDSLFAQTYKDFTLFVRDDCSADRTAEIIRSYKDERIRILPSDAPSGSAQNNFFRLLAACDSDYILFCDADDVWLPDKIEKTLVCMRAQEQKYGKTCPILIHTDLSVVDANLQGIAPSLFHYEKLSPARNELHQMLVQNNVTGCTVMINAALHRFVPDQPPHSVMHDWWLALVAAAFGEIAVVDEPLVQYRQHGGNEVGAYNASDLALAAKKLSRVGRMRQIYSDMYAQAGCFAKTFRDYLSPQQLAQCTAYAAMADRSKLGKWATIVKNKFYKNTFLRNVGQFFIV